RAGRAYPVDEPACGAVPCGRGLPRDVRRRFRRGPVYAARRDRRRPPGADRTRPPGRAAAPRARVPRGRAGGPGGAMMKRALLLVCLLPLLARAEPPVRLAGHVTDDAGRPVVGALVTARHLELAREESLRQCTFCHQQGSWATRVQRDPEQWRKLFVLMARMGGILSTRVRTALPEALNAAYDESSYVPALGEHFAPPPPPDAVAA